MTTINKTAAEVTGGEQCPWFGGWLRHRTSQPVNMDQMFLSENYSTPRQPNMWRCDSSLEGGQVTQCETVPPWFCSFRNTSNQPSFTTCPKEGSAGPQTHTSMRKSSYREKCNSQSASVTTHSPRDPSPEPLNAGLYLQFSVYPVGQAQLRHS